jgi:hypothetical protein
VELGDLDFAGGDADGDALAVGLLAGDALDVDNVLEAVAGGDLALTALVAAALDDNLVVRAEGDRADLVDFMLISILFQGGSFEVPGQGSVGIRCTFL